MYVFHEIIVSGVMTYGLDIYVCFFSVVTVIHQLAID